MPAVQDFDRIHELPTPESFITTPKRDTTKSKRVRLVIITSSDEEDDDEEVRNVIVNPDRHPARQPFPPQPKTLHQLEPASQSEPLPQSEQASEPETLHQSEPAPQPEPLPQSEQAPQTETLHQSEPAPQPKPLPQSEPLPPPPSLPNYPQRVWAENPNKLTISKIKEVLQLFKVKWRSGDKKAEFVGHYKALAQKQQEIWRVYKEAVAKQPTTDPTRLPTRPIPDALPEPTTDALSEPTNEIPVNIPVTRSKTKNGNNGATIPTRGASPRRTGSVELLGTLIHLDNDSTAVVPEIPNLDDNDSIPEVPTIPDLINLLPRGRTAEGTDSLQPPSHNRRTPLPNEQLETPLPTRRLAEWAAGVDNAMHETRDPPTHTDRTRDTPNHTNKTRDTPTHTNRFENPDVLTAALLNVLVGTMMTIANGVTSISSSLQGTPTTPRRGEANFSTPRRTHRAATRGTTSQQRSRAAPMDEDTVSSYEDALAADDDDEAHIRQESAATPLAKVRNTEIAAAVRKHCSGLIGVTPREPLPPPATEAERMEWIDTLDQHSDANASDADSEVDNANPTQEADDADPLQEARMDIDVPNDNVSQQDHMEVDPQRRAGPYHPGLTREALQIMRRQMRRARIDLFRPDLSAPLSLPSNRLLWDLAIKLFVRLVLINEYPGITPDICNESMARTMIHKHVEGALMRRYRKQRKTAEEQAAIAKATRKQTRRATLREWRLGTLVPEGALIQLMPIVECCCSDDETDDEAEEPLDPRQKVCVVLAMPWRHPRITDLMNQLDHIRLQAADQTNINSNAPPARVRRRSANANVSTIQPPAGLPIGVYNPTWMQTRPIQDRMDLKTTLYPVVHNFIEVLKSI
ncbi:hypothetical protein MJO29_016546 [Puccinia striiformis f. sp. tritici]|nr:hypothetical protein MJO29_016546 [Puccinia striiformis f. sp. tritici]